MLRHFTCRIVFLILAPYFVCAQSSEYTLQGYIRDAKTGEELIGATIAIAENTDLGTTSNAYGFYSFTLPAGIYTLRIGYIGYQDLVQNIDLSHNQKIDLPLLPTGFEIKELVVGSKRDDNRVTNAQMGTEKLDVAEIAKIPVIFGEKDLIKTMQLFPGVKSASEGSAGFNVRGGSTDQNLIILDEAPVYNASHLLGFFSTFNSDAIKDATLIKGNAPAQYGGRLSSVLDVKMNEGNDKKFVTKGGIGLISTRLSVEGPAQKNISSFLVSGRRTYVDALLGLSPTYKENTLYFYDFNCKFNYRIDSNNRIFISGYFGHDALGLGKSLTTDWGNTTATLRWNRIINPKLFSNTSFIFSDYNYKITATQGSSNFNISFDVKDFNIKQEYQFFPSPKSAWRFGVNSIYHNLSPSRVSSDSVQLMQSRENRFGWENALFANNTFELGSKNFLHLPLHLDYGLRLSSYSILGAGKFNIYKGDVISDSIRLENNAIGTTYFNMEPRFSICFELNKSSSLKISYGRNTQNLHLLTNATTGSPTDIWVGNSYNIKPELADQIALGYFREIKIGDLKYELSVETYYKNLQNQVDYKRNADIQTATDIESELLHGQGRAYGFELLVKKKTGRLTGWLSYTLSRTERQINGINGDKWYPAKQDRTHDIAIVGVYQLSQKWLLAATWVYYTGNAVTFPVGKYLFNNQLIFLYSSRNSFRMPDYHRLDLSATFETQRKGRYQSSWNFSLYNAYGQENAYQIAFNTQTTQTALFRWVPGITYNFKF
jgi:hypothetical protein